MTDEMARGPSRRSMLGMLASVAAVPLLPACSAFGDAGADGDNTGTLTLAYLGDATQQKSKNALFAEFTRKYPKIRIEANGIASGDWGTFANTIITQIAGGKRYDVIDVATEGLQLLASKNVLEPLDRFIAQDRAYVQDEGSQLCAIAAATAPVDGRDELWLDACAGPGGKAALLAALAAQRGAHLVANERREHRAELVRRVTEAWNVEVTVGDARALTPPDGGYDRVLLDAPCTGLGALRRRPEARWRRSSDDVGELAALQRELLGAALHITRPGGVVVYVTCSPHRAETLDVVAGLPLVDARPLFAGVSGLGTGPTVQLWPHRHGTDAMFCAVVGRE